MIGIVSSGHPFAVKCEERVKIPHKRVGRASETQMRYLTVDRGLTTENILGFIYLVPFVLYFKLALHS